MAFGQQSGPPAPANKVRELLELLHDAGHTDFRDARGPMGFTQRQAGGKFTRDEADAFIEQLEEAGWEILEYSPEERAAMVAHIQENVWPELADVVGQDLIDELTAN